MKIALSFLLFTILLPEVCFGVLKCDACLPPALGAPQCKDVYDPGEEITCGPDSVTPYGGTITQVCVARTIISTTTGITHTRGCAGYFIEHLNMAADRCPGNVSKNQCLCVTDNCNKPDANYKGGPGGANPSGGPGGANSTGGATPGPSGGTSTKGTPNSGEMKALSSVALVVTFILSSICLLRGIPT